MRMMSEVKTERIDEYMPLKKKKNFLFFLFLNSLLKYRVTFAYIQMTTTIYIYPYIYM